MIRVRLEKRWDEEKIRRVNREAFGREEEARLVDRLRASGAELLSFVGFGEGSEIVCHLLFSPVELRGESGTITGMGLGPVAVRPGMQGQGIGTYLIENGIGLLRESGCLFVVVLGHPEFYGRFGFRSAAEAGIAAPWPGLPEGAFMALILDTDAMAGRTGTAHYRPEFDDVA